MNFNGFYALDFGGAGYAELPWKISGTDGFSISIRCLTDNGEDCGILAAAGGLFSVGLEKGYMYIKAGQADKLAEAEVPVKCWNRLTITYNGKVLRAYCNHMLMVQAEMKIVYNGIGNIRLGEGLKDSYVQRVFQYNRCLTEKEIVDGMLRKTDENAVLQADFGSGLSEEKTYRKEWLQGCRVKNLVYTLNCNEGELTADVPEKLAEEYSILCTCCCLETGQRGEDIEWILSWSDLKIGIRQGDTEEGMKLFLQCGDALIGKYVRKGLPFWMDLALVGGGGSLSLYMNGKPLIKYEEGYSVPAGKTVFGKFAGYIDHCAVIDHAVTEEELQQYENRPSYVFEKGLRYLFCFADSMERECCCGLPLLAGDTRIVLAKETGAEVRPAKEGSPGPVKREKEYSSFAKWQVETVLRLLVEWIAAWMGAYPNRGIHMEDGKFEVEEGLYAFTYREIVSLPEAQELLANYDDLTEELLFKLIDKMKETGVLEKLLRYLYQEDEGQDSAVSLILALLLAAAAEFYLKDLMSALGAAIKAAPSSNPPEPPDTDEDEDEDEDKEKKKKKTYLSVRQTSIKGNVGIDYGTEKRADKGENRAAFYFRDGENSVKLKADIFCKGEGGEFVIKAGNKAGSILKSTEKNVTLYSEQTTTIELDVRLEKTERKYGKWKETIHWSSESKNQKEGAGKKFLRDTEYEIHILEGKPCEPWKEAVAIECLELCAACAEHAGGNSKGFCEDYAQWLGGSNIDAEEAEDITSNGMGGDRAAGKAKRKSYSRLPSWNSGKKAAFDAGRFSRDFPAKRRTMAAADLSYSHALFCRLQGQEMSSIVLTTGMESRFLLKEARKLPLKGIHYVSRDAEGRVYDYALNSYGLPFSNDLNRDMVGRESNNFYRERNYVYGSYCMILTSICKWQLEDLPEEGDIPAWEEPACPPDMSAAGDFAFVIRRADGVYIRRRGVGFDREIRARFLVDGVDRMNICHSISAKSIDETVADLLNAKNTGRIDMNHLREGLSYLKEALWPEGHPERQNEDGERKEGMENLVDRLCLNVRRGNNENIDDILPHLGRAMYNAPWNLRIGRADWNQAIQDLFDPSHWFYYDGEMISSGEQYMYREALAPEVYYQEKGIAGIPFPGAAGFYLPNIQDRLRIHNFRHARMNIDRERHIGISVVRKLRVDNHGGEMRDVYPVICSSSNEAQLHEPLDGKENLQSAAAPVFYLGDQNGRLVWIRLQG